MSSPSAWPLPTCKPSRVGLSAKRLQRVTDYLTDLIDEGTIAGAITVMARRGRIAHLECHGFLDVEFRIPMQEDAIFRLYSMTKPIVCVATLMLVEECRIALHDPVSRYLPGFANVQVAERQQDGSEILVPPRRPITIHDLLTHTGGLSYAVAQGYGWNGGDNQAFIDTFVQAPLLGHPGEQWRYSSSNDVLGCLIEVVAGETLDAFLAKRIFKPLGMTDTAFFVPNDKRRRFATLYEHDDHRQIRPKATEDRPYLEQPHFLSGGAGLVGTTSDYLRFCLMLLGDGSFEGKRLLSRKTVELMRQDHLPLGHPAIEPFKFGYGYGVSVVRSLSEKQGISSVGEFGWGGAAGTNAWIDPSEDLVSMVMFQLKPSKVPQIDHRIKTGLTQAIDD
jgi:CubicO group peptidase (beta-lactamase class C family)